MRPYRNPGYTDAQRERHYSTAVDVMRDTMEPIWQATGASSLIERAADLLEKLRPKDNIFSLLFYKVISEPNAVRRPLPIVPQSPDEKYFHQIAQGVTGGLQSTVRNSWRFGYIVPIVAYKEDEITGDWNKMLFNSHPKKYRYDALRLNEWLSTNTTASRKYSASRDKTIDRVRRNSQKTEDQRRREKHEEIRRRRKP